LSHRYRRGISTIGSRVRRALRSQQICPSRAVKRRVDAGRACQGGNRERGAMERIRAAAALTVALVCAGALATAANGDVRLVAAVQRHDAGAAQGLVKQGVDVNAAQPDGATALAWAAHWDDFQIADVLIRAGANVNTPNDLRVTPLMLAATNGSSMMIEKLL